MPDRILGRLIGVGLVGGGGLITLAILVFVIVICAAVVLRLIL